MHSSRYRSRKLILALALLIGSVTAAHARLISVDLQSNEATSGAAPQNFSGVETEAAGINSLFGAANVWNHPQIPRFPATTNPTFANLVDSTGASTTVSFAISGTVSAFNIFTLVTGADALRGDAFYFGNVGIPETSISVDWTLTGLTPNTNHLLFAYGTFWNGNDSFNMLVDTDGDGDLGDETAQAVISLNGAQPPGTLFSAISDTNGVIRGRGTQSQGQARWAGFQIAEGQLQVCGNSVVEGSEQCDLGSALNGQPGVCCTNTCTFTAVNTTCRSANGLCDVTEVCSGASATCPVNGFASAGTGCGGNAAACDALDTCNGSGSCIDNIDPSGTVCASATGICDPADTCDGANKNCPITVADAGTACGGSDAECDAFDTCNGSGGCVDNLDAAGTVCRPGVDACDMTEACTGNSTSCPVDVGIAATTRCTVNGLPNQPCQGGVSDDIILGTSGNDVIRGGAGADTLKGNAGDDLLCGEEGDDTLLGAHGADTLLGGQGSDVLKGEAGNDTLEGGSEDDTLIGGTGVDALDGGSGNDKLIGNEDADVLLGDTGNDILNGGGGNDVLDGEAGFDDLTGGPDLDTCLNGEQLTACE